ncbi:MAG: spore germination protein, partial [Oscillospiraceae bacterium]
MQNIVDEINDKLKDNFDFKKREIGLSGGAATVFFMATLSDSNYISMYIIKPLTEYRDHIIDFKSISEILQTGPVGELKNADDAVLRILFGDTVIALPFINKLLFCETRQINSRSIGKTEFDVSLKGSKESFNELIFDNIGLIRKRIISDSLKVLPYKLGKKSNTTAALVYLDGIAPPDLIKLIRDKLESLDTDYVLSINNISEALKTDKSSFDTSGFSEKPDTLVSRLYEGRVAVIVEGSPFVLTVPSFFIENFQSSDDYYSNRFQTGLVRFIRISALIVSLTLPALY